ncbi:hypothetical protein [Rhodococcus sp. IEGM 1318]|uniref:hypothetical protein n=1 Tax=Rhodococcus sp. IEGM 1318 TaxID=3082226 RepID=UPI0029536CFD|nr:hypothetical protein [Rhodococcus sp. IEGM 1318]MDV8008954.1 hypothetical protein [Rhodococcus sp. IEGM 1318]
MPNDEIRLTRGVQEILALILKNPDNEVYGYRIMDALGYSSGKTYRILARLVSANWLIRNEDGTDTPSGRQRVTYSIAPAANETIRAALSEAAERERSGSRFRAHAPRLTATGR